MVSKITSIAHLAYTCRPFGDLSLALLATERLFVLYENAGQHERAMKQLRDKGVLLCHLQQFSGAQEALQVYEKWSCHRRPADKEPMIDSMQKASSGEPVIVTKQEADLVAELLLRAQRHALEKQL
jgi:hypothetical protein